MRFDPFRPTGLNLVTILLLIALLADSGEAEEPTIQKGPVMRQARAAPMAMDRNAFRMSFGKRMDRNAFRMSFGKRSSQAEAGQLITNAHLSPFSSLFDPRGAFLAPQDESPRSPRWGPMFKKRLDRNLYNIGFGKRR